MSFSASQVRYISRFKACLCDWVKYYAGLKGLAEKIDDLLSDFALLEHSGRFYSVSERQELRERMMHERALRHIELNTLVQGALEIAKRSRFLVAEVERQGNAALLLYHA